ncbi:hypothetical protein RUM44_006205 [Polyplax serrata]|uniref:Osteopetrosis-associated transmembrane protein 1 n=1 Tax=Polyplax serrata TaxID=468196 RepID=A0ABR1AJ56_POLSC
MLLSYILYIFLSWKLQEDEGKVMCNILKHSRECTMLIDNFAISSASFINCTLQNARPVQMCCSCAAAYSSAIINFENISKSQVKSNSICDEKLLNQDRLAVFETTVSYIQMIWAKGQCSNCLDTESKGLQPSNSTKEFKKFYEETNSCLSNHYDPSNKTYNKDVCQNCSSVYFRMNKFYSDLKEHSGNGLVCMDIVDTMNVTQHLWSNLLHCGKTIPTFESPLMVSCVMVLMLSIAFYLGALKFSKTRSATVLHRNRLSQRFGERWRNRAGSSISN